MKFLFIQKLQNIKSGLTEQSEGYKPGAKRLRVWKLKPSVFMERWHFYVSKGNHNRLSRRRKKHIRKNIE